MMVRKGIKSEEKSDFILILTQGRIQKNSKGRVMNRSGAPTQKLKKKTQRISATLFRWCPIFIFFKPASGRPVVPRLDGWGPWCPWQARGAYDWCHC